MTDISQFLMSPKKGLEEDDQAYERYNAEFER
jgi:hypothetical protein